MPGEGRTREQRTQEGRGELKEAAPETQGEELNLPSEQWRGWLSITRRELEVAHRHLRSYRRLAAYVGSSLSRHMPAFQWGP